MSKTVLITGGAGYIGSHAVYAFQEQGWNVVVLDNLSTGIYQNISSSATFIQVDLSQADTLDKVISAYKPEAIVHFAGSIIVPESVRDPLKYYDNNTNVTRKLLECSIKNNVKAFLFSSTAAVYGEPKNVPIDEDAPLLPINPYGSSKLASEYIVKDCGVAYGLQYGILRLSLIHI
jgi:UDP-glucose 4-epimerase